MEENIKANKSGIEKKNFLILAVLSNDIKRVDDVLQKIEIKDINYISSSSDINNNHELIGMTALHIAVEKKFLDVVIRLKYFYQENGLSITNLVDQQYNTPLILAIKNKDIAIFEQLISLRKKIDSSFLSKIILECRKDLKQQNLSSLSSFYTSKLLGVNINNFLMNKTNLNDLKLRYLSQLLEAKIEYRDNFFKISNNMISEEPFRQYSGIDPLVFFATRVYFYFEILIELIENHIEDNKLPEIKNLSLYSTRITLIDFLNKQVITESEIFSTCREIRDLPNVKEFKQFYANNIAERISNSKDTGYVLWAGYSEHAIYINFGSVPDKNEKNFFRLIISNLGLFSEMKEYHPEGRDKNHVFPYIADLNFNDALFKYVFGIVDALKYGVKEKDFAKNEAKKNIYEFLPKYVNNINVQKHSKDFKIQNVGNCVSAGYLALQKIISSDFDPTLFHWLQDHELSRIISSSRLSCVFRNHSQNIQCDNNSKKITDKNYNKKFYEEVILWLSHRNYIYLIEKINVSYNKDVFSNCSELFTLAIENNEYEFASILAKNGEVDKLDLATLVLTSTNLLHLTEIFKRFPNFLNGKLFLSECTIKFSIEEELRLFFIALSQTGINYLDFSDTFLGEIGIKFLVDEFLIRNKKLTQINLSATGLNENALIYFFNGLIKNPNKSIKIINIFDFYSFSDMKSEVFKALCNFISDKNQHYIKIECPVSGLSTVQKNQFLEALQKNTNIIHFEFESLSNDEDQLINSINKICARNKDLKNSIVSSAKFFKEMSNSFENNLKEESEEIKAPKFKNFKFTKK